MESDIRNMAEELTEAIESAGTKIPPSVSKQFWRIVGFLEARQRTQEEQAQMLLAYRETMKRMERQMYGDPENPEQHPGIVQDLGSIKRSSKLNRKILSYVAGAATTLVVKALWEVITHSPGVLH